MVRADRPYFLLLVGLVGAIGIMDTAVLNPTIAAYARSMGADEPLSSFIAGLYSIIAIPSSFALGLVIDVIGRRRAMIIGIGSTALWIYGYGISHDPIQLILFRIAHSVSGSLVFPASIAMAADTTKKGLGRGLGIYWILIGGAIVIGSSISAILVRTLGFRPLFSFVAIISLLGALLAFTLPETGKRLMPKASLRMIASSIRWLSAAYSSIFSLYFAFGVVVGSLSLALISLNISAEVAASTVGIYIALATLVSLPFFYIGGKVTDKAGPIRVLSIGAALSAASQFLLVLSLRPPLYYVSSILLGVSIAFVYVGSTALAALPEARGVSIGLHQTANVGGIAVAAPLSGLLLKYFGVEFPFAVAGLVQLGMIGVLLASKKAARPAEEQILKMSDEPVSKR